MKLLRTKTLLFLYIFLGCFNKCVQCDLDNEEERSLRNTRRDEMEYLDDIDDSYFNERLKDNSADDDIEGDNIFVRSPYLNSKYNSKDKAGKNGKNRGKKTNLKHMMTDKTTGFLVSFILATLFISVIVIVAIIYKRHQMKKTAVLKESNNLVVEAV
ncbi:hypothetical protein TOT_030000876 [Theileria orientalis strain Shintoku]|uniref:Uncharacterized protein n=1 Tax=Theileria orientalis strain Shintoku TaxID=869250 RepID=J4CDR7_THEOR|nr:hypothetical protein TOT_030000876 [Theileria orientalis strain Shintoku]BAM41612.1 hypothetical protein TOT_030000876 [Theileria orientalis strain Shintoku]|eukprot:XP_009691913.1 hypothetical protein TOT_030000876 [Theileria orientalis strain Shintoku]